jgi:hypothetical protein
VMSTTTEAIFFVSVGGSFAVLMSVCVCRAVYRVRTVTSDSYLHQRRIDAVHFIEADVYVAVEGKGIRPL